MCGKVDDILSTIDKKPLSAPFTLVKNASAGWDPVTNTLAGWGEHGTQVVAANPIVQTGGTIAAGMFGGPAAAAAAQAAFARENGGSWDDVAKRAAVTYLGGSVMQGVAGGAGDYSDVGGGVDQYGGNAGEYSGASNGFSGGGPDTTDYGSPSVDTSSANDYSRFGEGNMGGSTTPTGGWQGPDTSGGLGNLQSINDTGMSPYAPQGTGSPIEGAPMSGNGAPQTPWDTYNPADNATPGPANWWQDMGKMGKLQMYQGGMKTLGGIADSGPMQDRANALRDQRQAFEQKLNSYYAPGSPEAAALQQEMSRKDAAAGRNSQYGTRATDIAAKIATMQQQNRTSALPTLQSMNQNEGLLRNQSTSGIIGGLGQMGTGWGMNQLWG